MRLGPSLRTLAPDMAGAEWVEQDSASQNSQLCVGVGEAALRLLAGAISVWTQDRQSRLSTGVGNNFSCWHLPVGVVLETAA